MPLRHRAKSPIVFVSILVFAIAVGGGLLIFFGNRSSENSLERALAFREQGEISASIIELKSALQKDPENVETRISLGQIYLDIRDLASADKELRRARTFGATAKTYAAPLSQTWLLQRTYQRVLDELDPGGLDPATRAIVLVAHARSYAGLGQVEKAQNAVSAALDADPQNIDAWIESARLFIQANDFVSAQKSLTKLEALAPNKLEATALRGDFNLRSGNFVAAVASYQSVIESLPGHIPTKVALANALLAQGVEEEADRVLENALAQVPTNADANYLNAYIALQNEEYRTALESAEHALRSNPDHLPSLLIAGAASFAVGRLASAERNMRQVLVDDPQNVFATELLTAIDDRQRRLARDRLLTPLIDDSAPPATVAAAVDPESRARQVVAVALGYLDKRKVPAEQVDASIETKTRQAESFLRAGQAENAFRVLEPNLVERNDNSDLLAIAAAAGLLIGEENQSRLILRKLEDSEAETADVHYLLALAYQALGDQSSADTRLARSLAADSEFLPAIGESARTALARGQLDRAEKLIRGLGEHWLERPELFDLLGGLALLRGSVGDAVDAYRRALTAAPTSLRVLRVAYAENRASRSEDSRETLKTWLSERPDDVAVAVALANKRLMSGEFLDAAELYSAVLRRAPDHVVAINNMAWVSLQLGDADVASRLARQGLDLAPDDPRLMDTLAEILMSENKFDEALPLLKRALQRDQSNPGLKVKLAKAMARTGNASDAREMLKAVLATHPQFPEREEAEQLAAAIKE